MTTRTRYAGFVAASIDGRISLTSKTLPNWTSRADRLFLQKSLACFDAVVVGRNTYLAAANRLRKRVTYVLTRRVSSVHRRGSVTFLNPDMVDIFELFRIHKKIAVLGGGSVYRFMLESGLLDEIFVTVEPLIFGRGKAMCIGGTRTTRFILSSVRRLNRAGTLLLHYRVCH